VFWCCNKQRKRPRKSIVEVRYYSTEWTPFKLRCCKTRVKLVDDWKAIEECALGVGELNLEDKLHQDEQKPAAILTKNPSVTQFAIAHLKQSAKPLTIPPENSGTILSLHGKIDDYFAEDDRKPAAS
jgi:hypothetical protein